MRAKAKDEPDERKECQKAPVSTEKELKRKRRGERRKADHRRKRREIEADGKAEREKKETGSEAVSGRERKRTEVRCLTVEERPSGEGTERRKERDGPKGTRRSGKARKRNRPKGKGNEKAE